ncbi:MAG: hypothetical protein QUS11_11470 [Candidatus Fermentibacter sp.]|nr:hypothetical protein [Candidatus Fermentibacter sp.]
MTVLAICLAVASAAPSPAAPAGEGDDLRLDRPVVCPSDEETVLQYDDGTACWLTWGGLYRGVWFDVTDFEPMEPEDVWGLYMVELWFYHYSSYPWDTASFYLEVYGGDEGGPADQISQTSVTASHMGPTLVYFDPPLEVPPDFWVLVNTEMSGCGAPYLFGDNGPNFTGAFHSFTSDDIVVWEPWDMGDFFIRCHGLPVSSLTETTWGALKSLF